VANKEIDLSHFTHQRELEFNDIETEV